MIEERVWLGSYPEGVPADIDASQYPSLVGLMADSFAKYANRTAYSFMGQDISYAQTDVKSQALAAYFQSLGLEKGDRVAIMMPNVPQYPVAVAAILRAGLVVVNVNPLYTPRELEHQLKDSGAKAIVIIENFAVTLQKCIAETQINHVVLCAMGDMLSMPKGALVNFVVRNVKDLVPDFDLPGAVKFNQALSLGERSTFVKPVVTSDDIAVLQYTGGTTGMPKGVMYPVKDFTEFFMHGFPSMIGLSPFETADQMAVTAKQLFDSNATVVSMSGPPLMHGTGSWLGLMFPHMLGGTSVMLESRGLKPEEVWDAVDQHKIAQLVIVGDAFAKPLLRALEAEPDRWNTSSLRMMISSGAMFTTQVKRDLIEHIPELAIADVLGSTEGGMGQSIMTKDTPASETAKFMLLPTSKVLLPDGSREVTPGSGEVGMVAQSGMVPLGYYKDPKKSAGTFKEIDGKRYAFPGDMATVAADGSINLLGRGSNCINTGGEKVFPEEVEEALKLHDAVEDALVFGLDDERFGSRVAGVVSLEKAKSAAAEDIVSATRAVLASYKLPKKLIVVPKVPRAPNGKADYKAAKQLLVDSRSTE